MEGINCFYADNAPTRRRGPCQLTQCRSFLKKNDPKKLNFENNRPKYRAVRVTALVGKVYYILTGKKSETIERKHK